ncbi:MAG: hypothetical protein EAY81_07885 [Bacteroidetes bacterium]|nr:MAG: hypothetical protein EAY81_07885 [Bacteroidota bacterium]
MKQLTLTSAFLLLNTLAFAWGSTGHRMVAQICLDHCSPKAKQEIEQILGNNYLTMVATWPDFIRSEKQWDFTKHWHYISVDSGVTVQQVIDSTAKTPTIDNVVEAIELMKKILNDDAAATKQLQDLANKNGATLLSGSIKATALAFLIHFIGDIHQPMHVGKTADFGGNTISVMYFSKKTNLHSVWDGAIIENEQLSFTEFAAFVNKSHLSNKGVWEKDGINTWATESVKFRGKIYEALYTNKNVDKSTNLPSFAYDYQHDFIAVVYERIAAAGYRAAFVVDEIFKE